MKSPFLANSIRIISAKFVHIALLSVVLAGFSACSTDFEVNEPESEIDIVYGLPDPSDSVQVLRITKAFLNNDGDVYELAKDPDVLYHKETLDVQLIERTEAGQEVRTVNCAKVWDSSKVEGVFAAPAQVLYKAPKDFKPASGNKLQLKIRNPETGVEAGGNAEVLGRAEGRFPAIGGSATLPSQSTSNLPITFQTGKYAYFYDITFVIHYEEFLASDTSVKTRDSLVWPWKKFQTTITTNGGEELRQSMKTDEWLNFLANNLKVETGKRRRIKKINIHLDGGSRDLYTYISLYAPSTGITQKRTDFTNIDNGYGLFAGRSRYHYTFYLSKISINLIKEDPKTRALNIVE